MQRNSRKLCAAVVALAATSPLVATGPAVADGGNDKPLAIVALGDSNSSGQGGRWMGNSMEMFGDRAGTDRAYIFDTGTYNPHLIYGASYDNDCKRSDSAPVMSSGITVPGVRIAQIQAFNLACSGAKTINLLRAHTGGQAFKGEKPQIDQLVDIAKSHPVAGVFLSIGGNDLEFGDLAASCVRSYLFNGEHCWKEGETVLETKLQPVAQQVGRVIEDIKSAMRSVGQPEGSYRIIVQSTPSMIPRASENRYPEAEWSRVITGGCPVWNDDSNWTRDIATPSFAEALGKVAAAQGVDFLDLRDAFQGREVCAEDSHQVELLTPPDGSYHEWSRFMTTGYGQGDFHEAAHANFFGQRAIGECLRQVFARPGPGNFACYNQTGRDEKSMLLVS